MRNIYPYTLSNTSPFDLNGIPVYGTDERIDFFYKYKRPQENLYIGNINKDNLLIRNDNGLYNSIIRYLNNKQFLKENILNDFDIRTFPKVCWLANSFIEQGFKFPVSVHYNPRIQQNVIHPGTIRHQVIKLFQQTPEVSCLYFNTGGVEFDFMKELRIFQKSELLTYSDSMEIEMVADHCSIIPHINLDVKSVIPNITKWQEFIYRRLLSSTFSIFCNKDIEMLRPWMVSEENADIHIHIGELQKGETMADLECKSIILSIIGKPYQSKSLTVFHKNSFETPS